MKTYKITRKVTEDMLAVNVKSGSLRVLATPVVVSLMEEASTNLADQILDNSEYTTVGTMISIEHISPTPLGAEVVAESTLVKNTGRFFEFEVVASDNQGVIARGKHSRVSVKKKKFQEKADDKLD